ncbi:MAG: tandem-95 repeat protein [Planctomycetota bacterium]|nr:tandem-95 repeat protein [Planctomycetota bacterium]
MTTKSCPSFRGLFRRLRSRRKQSSTTRRWKRETLMLEPLEPRTLLSGDSLGALDLQSTLVTGSGSLAAPTVYSSTVSPAAGVQAEGETQALAQDLVAFAKALTTAGLQEYGAAWCPHCMDQREMFQDGQYYLPLNEVTNPDRTLNALGTAKNISSFPTWDIPDPGHVRFNALQLTANAILAANYSFPDANTTRVVGAYSLDVLSQLSGVAIPTSAAPFVAPISDRTLIGGSALYIPLDGYDPNGDALTYTVTSDNAVVSTTIPQNNPSVQIDVKGWGHITAELYQDKAPRPVERFTQLAESGFYDYTTDSGGNVTNKVPFHRVISNFMIQGGDPTGTGSGGSTLGTFNDQFNVDLLHNSEGTLSFAKSADDTNDSQFFITLAPTQWLDFKHSVFGQVTEGYDVLEAIGKTATNTGDKPATEIDINKVTIFQDTENAVVMLKAPVGATGVSNITVTASDGKGLTYQRTFRVTMVADTQANGGGYNGGPFLADISPNPLTTTRNTVAQLQLQGIDKENETLYYDATKVGTVNYTLNVNNATGLVQVTPPAGYVGPMQVLVKVKDSVTPALTRQDPYDSQTVTFNVLPETPVLTLAAASDTGTLNDNITSLKTPQFHITNVVSGATVEILNGTTVVGQGTATGTTIDVTADLSAKPDGTYPLTAVQTLSSVKSAASNLIPLQLDTSAPAAFTSTPPTKAFVDSQLKYDAQNTDEGHAGFAYSLVNGPTGAAIDVATGLLTWTPTTAQVGNQSFQVRGTDGAGNAVTQDLNIAVVQATVKLRLQPTDLSGNPITHVSLGSQFLLRVFAQDVRGSSSGGVFSAYLNVAFDPTLASPVGQTLNDITFTDPYSNGKAATFMSGAINEVGAFAGTTALGEADKLMFSITMNPVKAGTINFTGSPATAVGHEVLVYGANAAVSSNLLNFVTGTLTIDSGIIANNDTFNFDEDSSGNSLTVLTNDVNNQGGTLTITAVGPVDHGGTVTIAQGSQQLLYTPAANFSGQEQFTYTIGNGQSTSTATVTVQVQPKNDPPTANNDTFTVAMSSQGNALDVLANDSFAPDQSETLRVLSVGTTDKGGTVTIAPNGTHLVYAPLAGFTGDETFTYTITDRADSTGLTAQATVKVTVTALPLPTVVADTATVNESSAATVINVLGNDTPGQTGDTLTVTAVTQPTNGTVTVGALGANLSYTPKLYFSGTDTFTYTVQESNGGTRVGTVTVTVTALPAPTAVVDTTILVGGSVATVINVLLNDTPNTVGHTLTVTAVVPSATGGAVAIGTSGANVTYTPKAGFFGTDTFTYTVREQAAGWATATVTVLVTPSPTDDTFNMAKNGPKTTLDVLKLSALNYPSTNPYQQLTITAVTASSPGGTAAVAADGKHVDFTPQADYVGADTFAYTVSDGNGHTAQGSVTVNLTNYTISGSVASSSTAITGAMRLVGIDLVLRDMSGNVVSTPPVKTDFLGRYSFPNLPSGQYTVSKASAPFLLDDPQTITVTTTGLSGSESTGNNFAPSGRKAAFISILDFLVTAPRQSSLSPTDSFVAATGYVPAGAADTAEAGAQKWITIESGWAGFTSVFVHLSQNPETVHIHAIKTDGTTLHHDLLPTDTRVQWLGKEGDASLLRIIGSAADLQLDNSECCVPAPSAAAAGEAGSTTSQNLATSTAPSAVGEGEAVALTPAAVTPAASIVVTPSSSLLQASTQTTPLTSAVAASELASASEPIVAASFAPVTSYMTASTVSTVQTQSAAVTTATSTTADATAQAVDAVMATEDFASTPETAAKLKASTADSSDYADAVDQVLAQTAL